MWSILVSTALAMPTHDAPLRVGQPSPDDVAVVVGIEDYAFLPDVPYAERDARAFHDLLVYTLGVPTDRVQLLDTNASKERIEAAIEEAAERVGSDGTLWVYFAGHGAASPSTGERVLLGIDTMADAQSFDVRSLPVARIEDLAPRGARTVLVVDACYAGAGRAGGELLPGQRFAVPTYANPAASTFVEWTAAQPNELSGPLEPAKHGAFTWAVVGALRGWADGQLTGEADGTITFDEADLYVQEVLRSVDVRDQRPALRVTDRRAVLATLPLDKLEARPEAAALRGEVQGGVASAPVAPMPAVPQPVDARAAMEQKHAVAAQVDGDVQNSASGTAERLSWSDYFQAGFGAPVERRVVDCKKEGGYMSNALPERYRGQTHPKENQVWTCLGGPMFGFSVVVLRASDTDWKRFVADTEARGADRYRLEGGGWEVVAWPEGRSQTPTDVSFIDTYVRAGPYVYASAYPLRSTYAPGAFQEQRKAISEFILATVEGPPAR